ncbi:uncharacterized protein [Arachis hypogaea]|uniref:uncharacterized protein n=1 Tax=Arachis hypogaea TaxID=3818 RepID=UPI003B217B1A
MQQKRRKLGSKRSQVVEEQVQTLLEAGFIREVKYPLWLANVVLVKKPNRNWRMCVDYTDLNKACPKDPYPLPNIDTLVDASSGYKYLSFMDAYSRYNQTPMHQPDQEKTSFLTPKVNYCYVVMPFEHKNAGDTYQRLMNKVFANHIGKLMEVYVDDMLIKIQTEETLLPNLAEVNPTEWNFYVDDSSNKAESGAGVILESEQGTQLKLCLRFEFPAKNNQAEYEALLAGLKLARVVGAKKLTIFSDSQEEKVLNIADQDQGWMTPKINYLKSETLPADKKDSKRLIREVQYYTMVHDVLYKREISTPLLKCVPTFATKEVLEEVHGGMCGNHLRTRALSKKLLRAGFYWPTLQKETTEFVKTCPPCQKHANFHTALPEELICVTSPWPFAKWGLDLLEPFP